MVDTGEPHEDPRYACLIGNGVSIGYSPNLAIAPMTTKLIAKFTMLAGGDAEEALKTLGDEAHGGAAGFESMLGPLEATSRALEALSSLAPLAANAPVARQQLIGTIEFTSNVHRIGLSTVLELVSKYGVNVGGTSFDGIVAFAQAIKDLAKVPHISVATLNYDGLTHAGFLRIEQPICDLASGRTVDRDFFAVVHGGRKILGNCLRDHDDLLDDSMALIQLHGSLAWLREPRLGMYKFDLEALRSLGYWEALRNGQTDWLPVVVLTDQKERQIQRTPFSLAYDIFQRRLVAADHWLIAGYGLKDAPVNELFRTAAMTRKAIALRAPKILVVDYGVEVDEKRKEASISLGLPENVIKVSVAGAPGVLKTQEWNDWAT